MTNSAPDHHSAQTKTTIRTEDLIISRNLAQDFSFTGVPIKQVHSELRKCFIGASVEVKDKSKPVNY